MRTPEEKAKEIDKLKRLRAVMPERSAFGTNNHKIIDLQIEVINGTIDEQDIEEREYYEDEETLEKDLSYEDANQIREAVEWLDGNADEVCSESDIETFTNK